MQQLSFIPINTTSSAFGGSLIIAKRKTKRPLSLNKPLHLVLKSNYAIGNKSLLVHSALISKILKSTSKKYNIKVYEKSIASNHIHLVVKGCSRKDLQNFFRVFAGHTAQQILLQCPIKKITTDYKHNSIEIKQNKNGSTNPSKQNKFWQSRLYSRIVSWGKDFKNVINYVILNTKESLRLVPYKTRLLRQCSISFP